MVKTTPRLSIELKTQKERDAKQKALSKAVSKNTTLRELIINFLFEYGEAK